MEEPTCCGRLRGDKRHCTGVAKIILWTIHYTSYPEKKLPSIHSWSPPHWIQVKYYGKTNISQFSTPSATDSMILLWDWQACEEKNNVLITLLRTNCSTFVCMKHLPTMTVYPLPPSTPPTPPSCKRPFTPTISYKCCISDSSLTIFTSTLPNYNLFQLSRSVFIF